MMQKLNSTQVAEMLFTLPGWSHDAQRESISRTYVFADFMQAFAFMTQIAMAAEKHNHHPEWSNVYNRVSITWTTHDVNGLSGNDIAMAQLCDRACAAYAQASSST
ncbi:MAG: 4a-hydroxytetrahydrobiopterin dehydratase [Burkholderiales bacterium RIFCSPLOWO2_02_FULL_57_36]|nr:MAG: 4a-hydroxytetrahydrobiopterin dehydratase [Burkholderiales bacterium RIFCSPLOWO2_02_FULL_57_36]OGB28416.1 MAG: 4a-hydroxytetrahydrobiopterin dehydratase [Burkholderiales bacterium RIFCSPLOWO2_12_FULL_61_40]